MQRSRRRVVRPLARARRRRNRKLQSRAPVMRRSEQRGAPMKPRYYVLTYDYEKEDYTPQQGVRKGPYSLFGLRKALRKLRGMAYDTRGADVYVYSEPESTGYSRVRGL